MRTTVLALFFALLASTAIGQHVPSLTVSGDVVTIDADIAWHGSIGGVELLQGTELSSHGVYASADGASPIVLRLPAGSHAITALGFPANRLQPVRTPATLMAAVVPPQRQEQINAALANMLAARDAFLALAPTAQEVADALTSFIDQTPPNP